ncbi:MAG: hypothetical protein KAG66_04045 [Methylococcales bacterium]|nr:hypothetical protein [Methylococcales bacterium]
MTHKLPSIPRTTSGIPKAIADVLNPIRDAIEVRFLGRNTKELVVTRNDLLKLGLVTDADLQTLDN